MTYPSIADTAAALRAGRESPIHLVQSALQRIAAADGDHTMFLTVTAEQALAGAQSAEQRLRSGRTRPLDGIPFSVKDLFSVRWTRRTCGARILVDDPPIQAEDAPAVARLREAGAVLVGKTNMHEFGCGATGVNPHFGTPRNPHDPSRISGGSSSGSAVEVARGLSYFSLCTDSGGSVRIPAALCGIVGFKPTQGAISSEGAFGLSTSLDHAGLLARSVRDVKLAFDCARTTQATRPMAGKSVGVIADAVAASDPEVVTAFEAALEALRGSGVKIVRIEKPFSAHADAICAVISSAEGGLVHRRWLAERPQDYGEDVRGRLEAGARVTDASYRQALEQRAALIRSFGAVWSEADVLISPTVPIVAPEIEASNNDAVARRLTSNTRLFNLLGAPACSVPCHAAGLPVGLNIAGPPGHDDSVLAFAQAFEDARPAAPGRRR